MDNAKFISRCKEIIISAMGEELELTEEDIFVVWQVKALQNNKALLSFWGDDAPYFEMTHDGDKNLIYVDRYHKDSNQAVPAIEEKRG